METTLTATKAKGTPTSGPMTADQLLRLPPDGRRYELVEGELKVTTLASPRHGRIAMRTGSLIEQYARQHDLGIVYAAETGFQLRENPDTVRAADAAFVAKNRIPAEGEPEGYWAIAPDLIVEVVSPSDSASEVQSKVADWLEAGCQRVWVVYPDTKTVTEYHSLTEIGVLTAGQALEGGDTLPGFACLVSEIFA